MILRNLFLRFGSDQLHITVRPLGMVLENSSLVIFILTSFRKISGAEPLFIHFVMVGMLGLYIGLGLLYPTATDVWLQ